MATENKDVELRIRARDYSQKPLDAVVKALGELEKAQDSQLKSAKAGQSSARELENSYSKIENALKALASQGATIKVFEDQAAALDKAKANADAARQALTEYSNSLAAGAEKTKEQIKSEERLARAVRATEKAQTTAQNRLDNTTAKLAAYGVATNDLVGAQQRIVTAIASGNAALERQSQAIDTVDDDRRAAIALAKTQADETEANAQREAAALAKVVKASKDAADWQSRLAIITNTRDKATYDAARADAAITEGMRRAAQQAEATAKGYGNLARAVRSVSSGDELAAQIANIVDPAAQALKTMDGLGAAANRLGQQIDAINGPVKNYRDSMQSLQAVQKNVAGVAVQIDAYRAQIATLRAARLEYTNARSAVYALTSQMRAGGGDAKELSTQLTAAQNTLKGAAQTIRDQVVVTRDLRTALNEAGVDVRKLADAEKRLVDISTQSVGSVNKLAAAYKVYGGAVESAANKQSSFFKGGRTTLDFTQRLKGELLALATAYVGIQGGIDTAKGALDAFRTSQKIESGLAVAFQGDMKMVRQESEYLFAAANRIGISFKDAAPAYTKFSIAARAFGFNLEETRFVFEKFAIASRDAGLSGSEFEGVLKAVEQMLSKGKIQAEELRGQLGDRLPGAFVRAAAGAKMTTDEFTKALEAGTISADYVINTAREFGKASESNSSAIARLTTSEAQFQNAVYKFQLALANGGFTEAYTDFITKLTTLLNSEQGANLAKQLSDLFSSLVTVLGFVADNIELVKIGFSFLIGLGIGKVIFSLVTVFTSLASVIGFTATSLGLAGAAAGTATAGLTAVGVAGTTAAGGIGLLRVGLVGLIRLIPGIGAVATAIWAATEAYDQFQKSRANADSAPDTGDETDRLKRRFPNVGTPDPGSGGTVEQRAQKRLDDEAEKRQKALDKARKSALKRSAKDELDERAGLIKDEFKLYRDAATKEISNVEERAKRIAIIDKQEKQALETDRIKFEAENAKSGEAAANKRVQLQEQVKNELLKIQDNLAKEEAALDKDSTFEERKKARVDAISHSYDKLKKTIASLAPLDKAGADEASKRLNVLIGQLQAQEEIKSTSAEMKRLEKELTDQQTLRQQNLDKEKALYDGAKISQQEYLTNTAQIQRAGDQAVATAADNLERFAAAAVAANAGILSATEQSAIALKAALAKGGAANTNNVINEQANKAQLDAIDQLTAKRDAADAIFKAQLDLRMIDQDTYAAKVNANADAYKTKILDLISTLQMQLETQRAQGILEGTLNAERLAALDAQIAKMQLLGVTTANARKEADTFGMALTNALGGGIDQALDGVVQSLTDIATGAKSGGDAFKDLATSALGALGQMLAEIAKAIAKQLILNMLASSGNPYLSAAGAALGGISSGQKHTGGIVGARNGVTRTVDPMVYAGAQRFHEGGLPGLRADEVPTILQKGEQVLARNDPNNILNGGGKEQAPAGPSSFKAVILDDERRVPEAMLSREGEKAFLVLAKGNAATLKQLLR